jgi:O-antigen/teichoic acid export membrane protein
MRLTGFATALGGYSVAAQLTTPISMVIGSWNDAASPPVGEAFRKDAMRGVAERFPKYQRSFVWLSAAAGIAICAALPLLSHFVAPAFRASLWIVPFLCASYVVESLYYPNSAVIFYANRTDLVPKITVTAGVLNVGLNFALISLFGVPGAIASRVLAMGFRSGAMWWVARRQLRSTTMAAAPAPEPNA